MIFKHTCEQVLAGKKTQTRRLVKPGEHFYSQNGFEDQVLSPNNFTKWKVHRTYAIQPSRGEKEVGRFLLKSIQRELLMDISANDARAELGQSLETNGGSALIQDQKVLVDFRELWNQIHTRSGTRWQDNPRVWVLTFKSIGEIDR